MFGHLKGWWRSCFGAADTDHFTYGMIDMARRYSDRFYGGQQVVEFMEVDYRAGEDYLAFELLLNSFGDADVLPSREDQELIAKIGRYYEMPEWEWNLWDYENTPLLDGIELMAQDDEVDPDVVMRLREFAQGVDASATLGRGLSELGNECFTAFRRYQKRKRVQPPSGE
ncbi:hypothetical protein [Schaalia canis]|uniref:Uncharacterized protein n=1 Tax=Schaalia canis TaxID=100469 RepID=A0A3P1SDC1_9ACTO|nr:hypothetical protein [Schaalia canis]RRC95019.1 hypothetical protein EII11_07210 [Schaalia canis]